jgi:hypothetical protein
MDFVKDFLKEGGLQPAWGFSPARTNLRHFNHAYPVWRLLDASHDRTDHLLPRHQAQSPRSTP